MSRLGAWDGGDVDLSWGGESRPFIPMHNETLLHPPTHTTHTNPVPQNNLKKARNSLVHLPQVEHHPVAQPDHRGRVRVVGRPLHGLPRLGVVLDAACGFGGGIFWGR